MKKIMLMTALSSLLLAGCGGGSDAPPPFDPTVAVPGSANDTSLGLTSYLQLLIGANADTKEPLGLGSFNPQAPDNTEPEVLS